jgi:hypothetical protein
MHAQPPTAKPSHDTFAGPWLPPVCYGARPYRQLCQWIDEGLRELETRYPPRRTLWVEDRHGRGLRHRR